MIIYYHDSHSHRPPARSSTTDPTSAASLSAFTCKTYFILSTVSNYIVYFYDQYTISETNKNISQFSILVHR